jgi:hypothetical protein
VIAVASDLTGLPMADPAWGPIRLVVADWETAARLPALVRRIARWHRELRGVLLVRLRTG